MKNPDFSQQVELAHLVKLALSHPNWRIYAEDKARTLAGRMPNRWGWLPAALSTALEMPCKGTCITGEETP